MEPATSEARYIFATALEIADSPLKGVLRSPLTAVSVKLGGFVGAVGELALMSVKHKRKLEGDTRGA